MTRSLKEVSDKAGQLATDASCSQGVREQAAVVRDLLELAATWPIPPSLNFDEYIREHLAGLCQSSGLALCRLQHCRVPAGAAGAAQCSAIRGWNWRARHAEWNRPYAD